MEKRIKERVDFLKDGTTRPNPKGDACVWTLRFHVEVESMGGIPQDDSWRTGSDGHHIPNYYLMRWNPEISSLTLDRYANGIAKKWENQVGDWSIWDWKDAHEGDFYFMLREGDGPEAGIVFFGRLMSDPYIDEDWRGTSEPRHYCLIGYDEQPSPADGAPYLSIAELEKEFPEIDWYKGHSGELLTEEQGRKLTSLLYPLLPDDDDDMDDTDDGEDDNDVFDADQGHGDHIRCIDDNVEAVIKAAYGNIGKNPIFIGEAETSAMDEGEEYDETFLLFASHKSKDVVMRTILVNDDINGGMELKSMFPYMVSNQAVPMELKRIDEYSNGFEAVLTCEYDGQEFSFFDVDYPLHKDEYEVGEKYPFALSALAYKAEVVPEDEREFIIEPEEVERMHANCPVMIERDKEGNVLPMHFYAGELTAYLPKSKAYPDDAEFQSPVNSRVRKETLFGHELYCMDIILHRNSSDPDDNLSIPLAARTSFFPEKPTKGTPIRGIFWLQGRMIYPINPKTQEDCQLEGQWIP